jgi:hypothetical protein
MALALTEKVIDLSEGDAYPASPCSPLLMTLASTMTARRFAGSASLEAEDEGEHDRHDERPDGEDGEIGRLPSLAGAEGRPAGASNRFQTTYPSCTRPRMSPSDQERPRHRIALTPDGRANYDS